jgi:ABC-2 family transporter protein
MIQLSWRQFRGQAAVAAVALAITAIVLGTIAPHLFHLYDASGVATCHARGDCVPLATSLVNAIPGFYGIFYFLGIGILFALPAIIGAFWGAPLVSREYETGTYKLAWTQGVSRSRWLAVKLGVVGLAAMATAGLFSLLLTWWSGPIDTATGLKEGTSVTFIRLGFVLFATRDVTPVAYTAFGFALGVAAGLLIRRTVPAMAVTLVVFVAVQIGWAVAVRPHLIPPARTIVALSQADLGNLGIAGRVEIVNPPATALQPGEWILSTQTIDQAGRVFNVAPVKACQGTDSRACQAALAPLRLRDVIWYQPASRFWAFQWYETGIFLALAVALAGWSAWWLSRHRVT